MLTDPFFDDTIYFDLGGKDKVLGLLQAKKVIINRDIQSLIIHLGRATERGINAIKIKPYTTNLKQYEVTTYRMFGDVETDTSYSVFYEMDQCTSATPEDAREKILDMTGIDL